MWITENIIVEPKLSNGAQKQPEDATNINPVTTHILEATSDAKIKNLLAHHTAIDTTQSTTDQNKDMDRNDHTDIDSTTMIGDNHNTQMTDNSELRNDQPNAQERTTRHLQTISLPSMRRSAPKPSESNHRT
jgi:hypothetical protein